MAGGKMSPRQKMINLMYLVFIAMIALNMSKEVLSAFGNLNEKIQENNTRSQLKASQVMDALALKASEQPDKYQDEYEKAQLIEMMMREKFSLDEMASAVCLSKYYFSRLFKEHIGESPGTYLHHKRMQTAMDLLLHSNRPIKEVQYLCGFRKYNYFLTVFRKFYGISPGSVRER